MWKWFILVWLAQWRTLSAQPVISENVRESRQLNLAECCPCNESETSADYDAMEAASADSCPCQTAPDSESAPSMFSPVRAIEPYKRSEAKTPKPLLKPEVGLASSVLKTLQKFTDQEYQEALDRDAKRIALHNDREEDLMEQEMTNTSRNIVNIILQAKDDHMLEDVMPEASHVQETRCVHPLGATSNFDQLRHKTRNNVLGKKNPLSKVKSGKAYYDMANSASNIQEHKIPIKSNILEDLKLKSDLLKMKLFSNTKNSLKDSLSNTNKINLFDKQSEKENSNDINAKSVPHYKLGSLLDYLKQTKQNNNQPTGLKEPNKKSDDDIFSPSNLQNNYLRNNERQSLPKSSKPLLHAEHLIKNNINSEERSVSDKFIGNQKDAMSGQSSQWKTLSDTNLVKPINMPVKDTDENECKVNVSDEQNLKGTMYSVSDENLDPESSPSELNTRIVEKSTNEINANEKYSIEDRRNGKQVSPAFKNNIQKEPHIKENLLGNYHVTEDNNEFIAKTDPNEYKNESNNGHTCDAEEAGSTDIFNIANNPQIRDDNINIGNVNDFGLRGNQLSNLATLSITTTEKSFVSNDILQQNEINILPNTKADVFKTTLEKIKNANEKIKDKLRLYAQNVPQIDVINDSSADTESSNTKISKNHTEENNNEMSNNISNQDLQEMSDRILNLSLYNEKSVEPTVLDATVSIKNNTKINENIDSETSPSESQNTVIEMKKPTPTSSDYLLKSSDEISDTQNKFNDFYKKQDKVINNDAHDSISRKNLCEAVTTKVPDNTEVRSTNDHNNEMMSQASSPFVSSIRQTKPDVIVQPDSNLNVKNFLENLRSSISDILNNENTNINRGRDNENDNSNRNSIYLEKSEQNDLNKSPFSLNEPINIDTVKSYAQARNRGDNSHLNKNNYQMNRLNSYKAKVASPDSLNLKAVPTLLNRKQDTLQRSFNEDPEVRSASTTFHHPIEMPSSSSLRNPIKSGKTHNSGLNFQKSRTLKDILPSESLNFFSETFKSRTEDALRNIKDSIDDLRRSHIANQNNLLGELHKPQNIYSNTLRSNDLDKKIQDFNSDVKGRLSQMSQRIPDIFSLDDESALQAKNKIKNINNKINSHSKYKHQVKGNELLKTKTSPNTSTSQSIIGSSKRTNSNLQQILNLSPNHLNANLRKFEDTLKLGHKFEPKTPLRKEIRRKPLKENKVTFSFTTPHPNLSKLRSNPKMHNKFTPNGLRSLINLPKSTNNTPLQKSFELKSKSLKQKADELKHSASNQYTSQILPGTKLGNPKTIARAFSSLEESMPASIGDLCEDYPSQKTSGLSLKNDPEIYEPENVLSNIRDAVNAKVMPSGGNLNKKILYNSKNNLKSIGLPDAKQSTSNNINTYTSSLTDRPLKENVSYKCKMMCFEDNEDSK